MGGIIFSGAGNDVVGKDSSGKVVLEGILRPYDKTKSPEWHIETSQCDAVMNFISNSYRKLFDTLEERFPILAFPDLKTYVHTYDYVLVRSLPNGDPHRKAWAANWTGDPLRAKGVPDNQAGSAIIKALIDRLSDTTAMICKQYPDRAVFVDLRGSVPPDQWADELHATSEGFAAAAERFLQYLP